MLQRHRRLFLIPLALAVSVAAVVLFKPTPVEQTSPASPEKPRPCRATFERVVVGMTLEQVEATVGAAPGAYVHGVLGSDIVTAPRGSGLLEYVGWVADDGELLVLFADKSGRLVTPTEVKKEDHAVEIELLPVVNLTKE